MKKMKIGVRLALGFLVVILLLLGTAGSGIFTLHTTNEAIEDMMHNSVYVERMSRDWARAASSQGLVIYAFSYTVEEKMAEFFAKEFIRYRHIIDEKLKAIEATNPSPKEQEMLKDIAEKRRAYSEAGAILFKLNNISPEGEVLGQTPPFSVVQGHLESKVIPARDAYIKAVDAFSEYQIGLTDRQQEGMAVDYHAARLVMLIIVGVATLIAILLAWRLTVGITRPLNEAVAVAETVASGDLTSRIEVKTQDETGRLMHALKEMNETLFNAILQVRQSADTIATASSEIAAGNQDLSSRTEEQASSLEETASSMEELTSTVRQNGDNARQANQLAHQAADVATKGGEAAKEVMTTMQDIAASSNKIVDIISVIDGIAFQTNILALNAAVEAARAGEQGRGFAVVATEVRSLAQRSATAAREIKDLIDDSVSKVSTGTELVNNATTTMLEIGESIRRVNDIMNEITMATQEQVQGIEQVNQAVTEMDTVSQQNAALVEEAAAASESLQDQARSLVEVVSIFNTRSDSSRNTVSPALPAPRPVAKARAASAPAKRIASPAKAASKGAAPAKGAASAPLVSSEDDNEDWEEF